MTGGEPGAPGPFRDRDGRLVFAVPLAVLESHRATPEDRAEFRGYVEDRDDRTMSAEDSLALLPAARTRAISSL